MWARLFFLTLLIIFERVGFPIAISTAWIMTHISANDDVEHRTFLFAFIAGIISDLIFTMKLGSMSLLLVITTGVLIITQSYLPQTKRLWLAISTIIVEVLRQWMYFGSVNPLQVGIVVGVALLISSLFVTQHALGSGVSLKQWMK